PGEGGRERVLPARGGHPGGVGAEGRSGDTGVALLAGLPGETAAEVDRVPVRDARLLERGDERPLVELRVPPRARVAAHVDERLHARGVEEPDELLERARPVPDRVHDHANTIAVGRYLERWWPRRLPGTGCGSWRGSVPRAAARSASTSTSTPRIRRRPPTPARGCGRCSRGRRRSSRTAATARATRRSRSAATSTGSADGGPATSTVTGHAVSRSSSRAPTGSGACCRCRARFATTSISGADSG